MTPNPRIFERRCRVTVDGQAIAGNVEGSLREQGGLRIGFTIDKDTTRAPNSCELSIYNLAQSTRKHLSDARSLPVVIEAGYAETGLTVLFAGEMREAFSRPEGDGTWATILRAGDGDKASRKARKATSARPGVSFDRLVGEVFSELKVGAGNLWQAIKSGAKDKTKGAQDVLSEGLDKSGYNGSGSISSQLEKLMQSAGLEHSVQDGELQVLTAGKALATSATFLSPATGLEGSPETTNKGMVSCRVRIIPGLNPGYPVELDQSTHALETIGSGWYAVDITPRGTLYRIEKTRYVGDTHGVDWNAELTLREVHR
jgi:hypothetical protein